jgi:hypothetical protein
MMRLRLRADLTAYRLRFQPMSREQALQFVERTREEILELFPGKDDVFNLVLRPRFLRLVDERFGAATSQCASSGSPSP